MANGTNKGGKMRGESVEIRNSVCSICGTVVSNRQSVAIASGRVCKSHDFATRQLALNYARQRNNKPVVLLAA